MKATIIYFSIFILFGLISCKEASVYPWEPVETPLVEELDYFPLKKGNVWNYKMEAPDNGVEMNYKILVTNIYNGGGKTLYEINEEFSTPFDAEHKRNYILEKTSSFIRPIDVLSGGFVSKLEFPLVKGKRWVTQEYENGSTYSYMIVTDFIDNMNVEAGMFDSVAVIKHYFEDPSFLKEEQLNQEIFLAPNVGLIKMIFYGTVLYSQDSIVHEEINFLEITNYNLK